MSRELIVARRYAKALYEVGSQKNLVPQYTEELRSVEGILRGHEELMSLLEHPNVETSVKTGVLQQLFGGKISNEVLNTLLLLVERKRSGIISEVLEQFINLANEALGRAQAIVYTPKALSVQEAASVAEQFSKLTGKAVQVENVVDPSLLGGLKVRIGDKLYDGSLSKKLEKLHKTLV